MRSLKPIVLIGVAAVAAQVESNSACGSSNVSTVYVTIPASVVTKTIYAVNPGPSTVEADTTVTRSLVSTQVINVIQASSHSGPYSFTEENGTTSWMGGNTPPASASLITSTSFITLQPVTDIGSSVPRSVSYLTVSSTKTITETLTKTLTQSLVALTSSAKIYTGFGASGWNATLMTKTRAESNLTATGSLLVKPSPIIEDKNASHPGTSHTLPSARSPHHLHIEPRQIGQIISATIDGVVVSWVNNWDGSEPTTTPAGPVSTPFDGNEPTTTTAEPVSTPIDGSEPTTTPVAPVFIPVTATAPKFGPYTSSSLQSRQIRLASSPAAVSISSRAVYSWSFGSLQSSKAAGYTPSSGSAPNTHTVVLTAPSAWPTSSHRSLVTRTSAVVASSVAFSNTSTAAGVVSSTMSPTCIEGSSLFTVDFDDLPSFSTSPDNPDIPPIFNPYRGLSWEGHFGYVPPPTDPFPPRSPPQLAVYRGNGLNINDLGDAGLQLVRGVGAGSRTDSDAYWIDAYSAWLGCANGGQHNCTVTINGYTDGEDVANVTQTITQPPCPGLKNCSLALVSFENTFRGLTGLQIIANVDSKLVDWYMDDLKLGWSNNTCAAQQLRSESE